jgi:hypothetical protein
MNRISFLEFVWAIRSHPNAVLAVAITARLSSN